MTTAMLQEPPEGEIAPKPWPQDPPEPPLTIEIYEDFQQLEQQKAAWDDFVLACGGPVFFTFDWVKTWWKFYGTTQTLHIILCRSGQDLVGILPLAIENVGIWPIPLRVARLIGSNLPPHLLQPPVKAGWQGRVLAKATEAACLNKKCDVLSLGYVEQAWVEMAVGNDAGDGRLAGIKSDFLLRDVHTTFHLPSSYEAFLESLDSRERKIRRKKLRDLEQEHATRVEVVDDPKQVAAEFEEFVKQHTDQWRDEGRPGHFGAWPRALEFHQSLIAVHGALGRVRFVKLMAGDRVLANQYTYAFGDAIYALLPARLFGPEWNKLSLGATCQIKLLENTIVAGFGRLESGIGHYEYKVLLNGKESPIGVWRLQRDNGWVGIKVKLYKKINKWLELILHKIWYRRIAPRLFSSVPRERPNILLRFDF